jgi:hypothetical protein
MLFGEMEVLLPHIRHDRYDEYPTGYYRTINYIFQHSSSFGRGVSVLV